LDCLTLSGFWLGLQLCLWVILLLIITYTIQGWQVSGLLEPVLQLMRTLLL
jgi:hypothetical protein